MNRVLAIARHTFAEGIRMRIVLVFVILLVFLVLRMPFALRGDETLTGRLQSFLAYSLGALSLLLSLATIFFSCSTLATEIRECSLHLVVTKPVTRFQILLGKWIGVNLLNLLILVLCGVTIYGLAYYIQSLPEQFYRVRLQVRDVVWTARQAATPAVPRQELVKAAEEDVLARLERGEIEHYKKAEALATRLSELLNQWRQVEPGGYRVYEFSGLAPPEREDTVLQVRYKALGLPLPPGELLPIRWVLLDPETQAPLAVRDTMERTGETHQFLIVAGPVVRNGRALLQVINPLDPRSNTTVFFEGDDSLQLLYRVSNFELNFVKGLVIIGLQLGLLSALGVFFSVFVSFPVACLCTATFYLLALGMPWIMEVIGTTAQIHLGEQDPYGRLGPAVRALLAPLLKYAVPDFTHYNGIGRLVDGLYIPPSLLVVCAARTLLYGLALLLLPGWLIFNRREIAEVIV